MEKPSIYKNPIDHLVRNNEEVFRIGQDEKELNKLESKDEVKNKLFGKDIKQKINSIFTSPNYIYKADVEIQTKNGTVIKKVIGTQGEILITMDNETIPFSEIIDIKMV